MLKSSGLARGRGRAGRGIAGRRRRIRRPTIPTKPVKIIVTVPAGGGVDTVTRIFADQLQQRLGQPFVIENRGGAGGNIGAEAVYTAEPDGYTLLASQPAPITTNVALYKKLNFDPATLEPVAVMSKFPNVLLVRQGFPGQDRAGVHRLREGQSGQGQLSPRRASAPPRISPPSSSDADRQPRWCTCPIAAPGRRSTTSSPAMSI